jgi:hypothetical protein
LTVLYKPRAWRIFPPTQKIRTSILLGRMSVRLKAAQWLQRIILTSALQNPLVALSVRSDWFWRLAFERTR